MSATSAGTSSPADAMAYKYGFNNEAYEIQPWFWEFCVTSQQHHIYAMVHTSMVEAILDLDAVNCKDNTHPTSMIKVIDNSKLPKHPYIYMNNICCG